MAGVRLKCRARSIYDPSPKRSKLAMNQVLLFSMDDHKLILNSTDAAFNLTPTRERDILNEVGLSEGIRLVLKDAESWLD
jgi:hypothetical protein